MFILFFIYFSLSIEDLIKFAEENSPYLLSLKKEIEARELEILPFSALPNPLIEVEYKNIGIDKFTLGKEEMSMLEIKIQQNLLYPKKLKAEEEISKEKKKLSEYFYKIEKAEARKRIREIFAEMYFLNKEKEGLKAGIELLNSLKISLSSGFSSDMRTGESFLKIELNLIKFEVEIEEIEQKISLYLEELKRITAQNLKFEDLMIEFLPEIILKENFKEEAFSNSPLIKYYEEILILNKKELVKRKLDLKPNISAFSGIGIRGGMDAAITVGTSIEFPLWKKKKELPLISVKEAEILSSEKMAEEVKLKIKEDLTGAHEIIKRTRERLKIYKENYLKISSTEIEQALSLYVAQKGDFSTVIEDINLWIEGSIEVAKLEAESYKAFSKILFHLGN